MSGRPLRGAIEAGRIDLVHVRLQQQEAVSAQECAAALQWASYCGDTTACRMLLAADASLSSMRADLGLNAAAFH